MQDSLKIKYAIQSVNDNDNTMVVKYWVEGHEDLIGDKAIMNIAIWKHPSTWEEIQERIKQCCPVDWFNLLISDTNLDHVKDKIGVEHGYEHQFKKTFQHTTDELASSLSIDDIDKLLESLETEDLEHPKVDEKEIIAKAEKEASKTVTKVIDTVTPLLKLLNKSPEQNFINWPGKLRVEKIQEIISHLEKLRDNKK